jgi:hypothetical protein
VAPEVWSFGGGAVDSSNGSLGACGSTLDCGSLDCGSLDCGLVDDIPWVESEVVEFEDAELGPVAFVGVAAVGAVFVDVAVVGGTVGSTVGETVTADPSGTTGASAVLALLVPEVPFVDASSSALLLPAHAAKTNVTRGMVKRRIRFI